MFTEKNKKINRLTLKHVLFLITYTIILIWVMLHLNEVFDTITMVIGMLRPFIYGIMMAFVFNIPMKFFLKKLPDSLGRWKKVLAAVCSFLIIFGILAFVIRIVMPQVIDSIASLANSLPGYIEDAQKTITAMIEKQQIPDEVLRQVDTYSAQLQDTLVNLLKNGIPHLLTMASGFASSLANVFMALVIAVYLTVSKDKLLEQSHRFLYAFTSQRVNHNVLRVARLTNTTFSAFITGQLVEAVIIGVLCYIGCLILGFPYAPILGVIIGCTNIIPIFGAIFGVVLCALLVAFVNPLQGVFFVIFGICLQQFESNLIYPRVVGTSVGLSGLWVLFAITVGGGLFGFAGMLLGLPTFSVIYSLLREEMNRRVRMKQEGRKVAEAAPVEDERNAQKHTA